MRRVPLSGAMFLTGFLAITGSPPFGPFISEFTIVNAAIGSGQYLVAGLFLLLMAVVFVGMGVTVLAVVQGKPREDTPRTGFHDSVSTGVPILLFLALVLMLGVTFRLRWSRCLRDAAALVGGQAMNDKSGFASLRNGQAIPQSQIPELGFGEFRRTVVGGVADRPERGCDCSACFDRG